MSQHIHYYKVHCQTVREYSRGLIVNKRGKDCSVSGIQRSTSFRTCIHVGKHPSQPKCSKEKEGRRSLGISNFFKYLCS